MDFLLNIDFGKIFNLFLPAFYFLFAFLYLIFSLVHLLTIKALNRTLFTPYKTAFNLLALLQVILGVLMFFFGLSFVF